MATKSNIKLSKQEENLSETNIKKVIAGLEPETGKPITKTLACQLLCISYNVKRLDSIITKFKDQMLYRETQMKAKRGTPASKDDIEYIIKQYMRGESVAQIAKDLFRGTTLINSVLDSHDVPKRPRQQDYFRPELIPDNSIRSEFEIGEKVYSARYDSLAIIKGNTANAQGERVYSIYLVDDAWQMWAYQPASELASLESLKSIGVVL